MPRTVLLKFKFIPGLAVAQTLTEALLVDSVYVLQLHLGIRC